MAPSITEEDALEFKNAFGCCLQELLTSELHEKYKKNLELFNHKNKGRGNNRSSHSNNNNNSHLQGKREPLTITKTTQITMESVANDMFLSNKKLSLFDAWQEICSNGIVGQKYLSQDSIERTKGLYADWAKNSLVKEAFDGDLPFLTLKIKVHTAITQSGVRNQHVGSWEETKMALEKALDGQVIFEDCSDSAILSELEAKGVECNSGGVASTEQKDDDLITNGEDNTDTDGHDSDLPYCGIPREEAFITSLLAQFNSGKDDGGKLVFDWATFSEEAAKLYNAPPSRVCFLRGCLDKKPTHSLVVDAAYESPRKKVSLTRKESTTEGASEIKKLASVERKKKKGQTGPNNPHYIEIFDDESDASPVKRIQSPRKCKAEQKCKAENKEPAAKRRQSPRKCKEKIDPTTVMARRMAKRIAIGEEVYKGECEVGLADGMLELKAKNSESGIEVDLNDRNVIGIKYFRAENEEVTHTSLGWTTWRYNCSFLAFQVIPTVENQLDRNYPKFISSTDKEAGYESMVVVEFRGKWNEFLTEIVKVIGVNSNWVEDLSWTDSTKYRTALDNNDNEIVLIYPFSGDHDEMETATKGLHEAKDAISINDDGHDICKVRKGRRQTFLTILETNMDRLVNGEWLNDTLIDFWIQW